MVSWSLKKPVRDEARELISSHLNYSGANRRAINLIPTPLEDDRHEVAHTGSIRYHQLLISIEGNQRSCCLKIVSAKKRSRAALLIYRGRVVGAFYGKKDIDGYYFEREALSMALADLAVPNNLLDAYHLPDELALASAAMFKGQVLDFGSTYAVDQVYDTAVEQIVHLGLPGCVVISQVDTQSSCMVYIAHGSIIGVYSSQDGWIETSRQAARRYLAGVRYPKVTGCILPIGNPDDLGNLGFSLTGLADDRSPVQLNPVEWKPIEPPPPAPVDAPSPKVTARDHFELQAIAARVGLPGHLRAFGSRFGRHAHLINP